MTQDKGPRSCDTLTCSRVDHYFKAIFRHILLDQLMKTFIKIEASHFSKCLTGRPINIRNMC